MRRACEAARREVFTWEAYLGGWLSRASRASCLEYIEKNWTGMHPRSLIEAQAG